MAHVWQATPQFSASSPLPTERLLSRLRPSPAQRQSQCLYDDSLHQPPEVNYLDRFKIREIPCRVKDEPLPAG